jgi:hypothetical protein
MKPRHRSNRPEESNYPTGLAAIGRSVAVGTLTSLGVYLPTQNPIWALCGYLTALLWGAGEVVRYGVMVDRERRRILKDALIREARIRQAGNN